MILSSREIRYGVDRIYSTANNKEKLKQLVDYLSPITSGLGEGMQDW